MRRPLALALLLVASRVAADPSSIKPQVAQQLTLYTDGKGHYVALQLGNLQAGSDTWLFYSPDGTVFWELRYHGASTRPSRWGFSLWEPRTLGAHLGLEGGQVQLECGGTPVVLATVPAAQSGPILTRAQWNAPRWDRLPFALLRDDKGTYYYVDREDGATDYQVFIGPRGRMKRAALRDVAVDPAGAVFATRTGDLRLVIDKQDPARNSGSWIKGKKRVPLTAVGLELEATDVLIYKDLGVYEGQLLGTPCDDM